MSLVGREQLASLQRQGEAEKAAAEPIMVPLPEVLRIVNQISNDYVRGRMKEQLRELGRQHRQED